MDPMGIVTHPFESDSLVLIRYHYIVVKSIQKLLTSEKPGVRRERNKVVMFISLLSKSLDRQNIKPYTVGVENSKQRCFHLKDLESIPLFIPKPKPKLKAKSMETPLKTNMTMENRTLKMHLALNIVIFHLAMLVCSRSSTCFRIRDYSIPNSFIDKILTTID